jgi:hypothetical protein
MGNRKQWWKKKVPKCAEVPRMPKVEKREFRSQNTEDRRRTKCLRERSEDDHENTKIKRHERLFRGF